MKKMTLTFEDNEGIESGDLVVDLLYFTIKGRQYWVDEVTVETAKVEELEGEDEY